MSFVVFRLLSSTFAAPAAAAPPTAAQADAFVHALYTGNVGDVLGSAPARAFDPSTAALIAENHRLTPKNKIGALDFSPFCWCQNDTGFARVIGPVHPTGPGTAQAVFKLELHGEMRTHVLLDLVTVGGVWRIHDLIGFDRENPRPASMRAILIRSNAMMGH